MYKRQQSEGDWVKYSFASLFFIGYGNYFNGTLASNYGYAGIFPLAVG